MAAAGMANSTTSLRSTASAIDAAPAPIRSASWRSAGLSGSRDPNMTAWPAADHARAMVPPMLPEPITAMSDTVASFRCFRGGAIVDLEEGSCFQDPAGTHPGALGPGALRDAGPLRQHRALHHRAGIH